MSSTIGSFGNSTTPRPTADAWCVYELDSNRNPIILDSVGVSSVTFISTGIFRVNFTNPERFASGAYVGLVQQELGNAQVGYGTTRVHGNPSDGSPLAIGVSGSCDIHQMGFANIANIATQAQQYSDLSNSFKARTNAAFFCLRSDSDTRKPAVANFQSFSEDFTGWTPPVVSGSLQRVSTGVNAVNPYGGTSGVFSFAGSSTVSNFVSKTYGSSGITYTFSLHAKSIGGATLQLLCGGGGNNFGYNYNVSTGAIVSVPGSGGQVASNGKITRLANGWNRLSMTFNSNSTLADPAPLFKNAFDNNNFLVFGAQQEEGSVLTPYIKTEGTVPVYGNQDALISFSPGASGLGQRSFQNLFTHSETFTNAAWAKTRVGVSAGGYVAPDGTTTAMKLVELDPADAAPQGGAYYKSIHQTIAGSTAQLTSWTLSVYAKAAERKHLAFSDLSYGTIGRVVVDLENGTVTETTPTTITGRSVGTPIIQNAGNGWWRVAVSFKNIAPSNNASTPGFAPNNGATVGMLGEVNGIYGPSYAGVSGSGILIWGAQLERGTVLGPYIRTTSTTVGTQFTRVAGLTYQSTPSQSRSRREATAWGTIVIPPNAGTSATVSAYLEGAYGVKKVVARDNAHFDVYFTDKMDVETYCVILGTEQETVHLPESSIGLAGSIPPTNEFTLDTIQNSMSNTTDIQRQVGLFTITSRRQTTVASTFAGAWTPSSIHYQRGRTQRINFMVFGGRTTNGTQ
jgi:hypothetical protein